MLEFEKVVEFPKNPKEVSPENQFAPVPFTRADLLIHKNKGHRPAEKLRILVDGLLSWLGSLSWRPSSDRFDVWCCGAVGWLQKVPKGLGVTCWCVFVCLLVRRWEPGLQERPDSNSSSIVQVKCQVTERKRRTFVMKSGTAGTMCNTYVEVRELQDESAFDVIVNGGPNT